MATCNGNSSQLLLLLLRCFFFILLTLSPVSISLTAALSFNFTSFSKENMEYERAIPVNGTIHLPDKTATAGRATYRKPLRLWDKVTGNLTDFSTHFSFLIDSQNRSVYGDGIAFFLAPNGSTIPDVKIGGSLGLTNDDESLNSTSNPFVAVEFDTFKNSWDPPGEHVGIDINSMRSRENITWWADIRGGKTNEAWITYDSTTQNLSVVFTSYRANSMQIESLDFQIDLRRYLPEWITFGFSAATGNTSAILRIFSWEFTSSLQLVDDNSTNTAVNPPSPNSVSYQRRGEKKTPLSVGLGLGGGVLVGALIWMFWIAGFGRKRKDEYDDCNRGINDYIVDNELVRIVVWKKFSYKELARATNNFKDEQKLGGVAFGEVYKGFLKDTNSFIAVKRVSKVSKLGIKEYASDLRIISRLLHRNIVQLLGWCNEKNQLLLVYEFMPNGSLNSHLFNKNSLLTWEVRYKIALNFASGLLYLQEKLELCVVHGHIETSNILLDSNFNAKIGDFGLDRFVEHSEVSLATTLAGARGYLAPERVLTGTASKESDIYSFGIVALEIACGRKIFEPMAKKVEFYLVEWVWELYGSEKLLEAADPRLSGVFDEQQLQRLMIVGLWCAHPDESIRPSIRQVIQVLNFESPLPILQQNSPVPEYFPPPMSMSTIDPNLSSSRSSTNTNSSQLTSCSEASSTTSSLNTRLPGSRIFQSFFNKKTSG